MTDTGVTPSTFNARIVALRFFFGMTCGREQMTRYRQFCTQPRWRGGWRAAQAAHGPVDPSSSSFTRAIGSRPATLLHPRCTGRSWHDGPLVEDAPRVRAHGAYRTAPNQVWLADLTYIRTGEDWLFLAALIDMHTRKVVGWSMRKTLHASIALEALDMAVKHERPAPGLIHSARGGQYESDEYCRAPAAAKITPSMSRKRNCLDNAPRENFFHMLKVDCALHRLHATRDEARRDLFAYIEGFYNSQRLHSAIGYRSPADMERMSG